MYNVQCAVCNVQCTVYNVHIKLKSSINLNQESSNLTSPLVRYFYNDKNIKDSDFLTLPSYSSLKISLGTQFLDQKLLKCAQDKNIKFQLKSILEINSTPGYISTPI